MSLYSDLLSTFTGAFDLNTPLGDKNVTVAQVEDYLVDGIVNAVKTSLESGNTTSVYNGTALGGVVTATVTGTSTQINASPGVEPMKATLKSVLKTMKTDQEWSTALANAIHTFTISAVVTETITGTTLLPGPPPAPAPVQGTASGTFAPVGLPALLSSISAIPATMTNGSNEQYAQSLANAVLVYFPTSAVNLVGMVTLTGVGTLQGNI